MNNDIEMIEDTAQIQEVSKPPKAKGNYFDWWSQVSWSTRVTYLRIITIPIIIFFYVGALTFSSDFFFLYGKLFSLVLFLLAVISIGVDDFVVRRSGNEGDNSTWLDSLSNKLLLFSVFILVAIDTELRDDYDNIMPAFAAIIVLTVAVMRELSVNALRMRALKEGSSLPADPLSRPRAVMYFIAIALFMLYAVDYAHNNPIIPVGTILYIYQYVVWFIMGIASVLSIVSVVNYCTKTKGKE